MSIVIDKYYFVNLNNYSPLFEANLLFDWTSHLYNAGLWMAG